MPKEDNPKEDNPKEDNKEWLLGQIKTVSEQLKDGRYNEIDLSSIEKEAPEIARNFGQVIDNLETAGQRMGLDTYDLPQIQRHLSHISDTTEQGVMKVINTAESIMGETAKAKESLDHIHEETTSPQTQTKVQELSGTMDSIQGHCFSIITALEFEDINRQLMGKILIRVNDLYDNLLKILLMLKLKDRFDKQDSTFLESLKHIIDIDGDTRQTQEMVDDMFEDFGF